MAYPSARDNRPHDRFQLINRRNIHPSRYTQTLISEALRVGMIPIELVDDVQMQVRGVLEEHLKQLRRESVKEAQLNAAPDADEARRTGASVDETAARSLLDSIFYSVDTYLLGFHDPMYAINALQGMAVDEMFRAGQKILKSQVCESVALSVQAKKSRIITDNTAYNVTLDEEIHAYLEGYDYRRAGHTVVLPMTYPLSEPECSMQGIHRLRDYLNRFVTENRFAALFEPEEKALLFDAYAKHHHTTTREMHVNFFSVIAANALGASILGKYTGILTLTEEEVAALYEKLYRKTTRETEHMAADAIRSLLTDLHPEPAVAAYISGHAKQFSAWLIEARNAGNAAMLFVPSDPKELFKQ